jgi:uncharacterized protein with GYD domain
MPKYLFIANYTPRGAAALMKEGGTARRKAAERLTKSLGGKLEAYYYAFGGDDLYVLADLPDNESAAALSLTVSAAGAVATKTVVLLTAQEIDEAGKKNPTYTPPGD